MKPDFTFSAPEEQMTKSRLIYVALLMGWLGFVIWLFRAGGDWAATVLLGSVFFVPMGILLAAEMRFPRKVHLSSDQIRFEFWHKKPRYFSLEAIDITSSANGIAVSVDTGDGQRPRVIGIPRSYPCFGEIEELLIEYVMDAKDLDQAEPIPGRPDPSAAVEDSGHIEKVGTRSAEPVTIRPSLFARVYALVFAVALNGIAVWMYVNSWEALLGFHRAVVILAPVINLIAALYLWTSRTVLGISSVSRFGLGFCRTYELPERIDLGYTENGAAYILNADTVRPLVRIGAQRVLDSAGKFYRPWFPEMEIYRFNN